MKDRDGRFLFHLTDGAGREVPVWSWSRFHEINVDQALFDEYPAVRALFASEDVKEGPLAFAEKRPPEWKGR